MKLTRTIACMLIVAGTLHNASGQDDSQAGVANLSGQNADVGVARTGAAPVLPASLAQDLIEVPQQLPYAPGSEVYPPGNGGVVPSPDGGAAQTTTTPYDGPSFNLEAFFNKGLGYDSSYYRFDALTPIGIHSFYQSLLIDTAAAVTDNGDGVYNFGAIFRQYDEGRDRIFGLNGYIDIENGNSRNYRRVGVGGESLGRWLDGRINGYFVQGQDHRVLSDMTVGSCLFEGHDILRTRERMTESAYGGLDGELGGPLPFLGRYGVNGYVGGYYLASDTGKDALGFSLRGELLVTESVTATLEHTNDDVFGQNTYASVALSFPSFRERGFFKPRIVRERMHDRVIRSNRVHVNIATRRTKEQEMRTVVENGAVVTRPWSVYYVDPNAAVLGDGTKELPFMTLAAMDSANVLGIDVIRVDARTDNTGENLSTLDGLQLYDNQYLLAGTMSHDLFVAENGTLCTLAATPGLAATQLPPILSNASITAAGSVIDLANNNVVRGFTVDAMNATGRQFGVGIRNRLPIEHFQITNNTIRNYREGVVLEDVSGVGIFNDNTLIGLNETDTNSNDIADADEDINGNGFIDRVSQNGLRLSSAINSRLDLSVQRNLARNNTGVGLSVTAREGSTIFADNPNAFAPAVGTIVPSTGFIDNVSTHNGTGMEIASLTGATINAVVDANSDPNEDTNGNGFGEDLNRNGILDPTEDENGNGVLDVFDTEDSNGNGMLDPADIDANNNGVIDAGDTDFDGDGQIDPAEDLNNNGVLDREVDQNGNGILDFGHFSSNRRDGFRADANGGTINFSRFANISANNNGFNDDGTVNAAGVAGVFFRYRNDGVITARSEDLNGDGVLQPILEDLNGNGVLDQGFVSNTVNTNAKAGLCIFGDGSGLGVFDIGGPDPTLGNTFILNGEAGMAVDLTGTAVADLNVLNNRVESRVGVDNFGFTYTTQAELDASQLPPFPVNTQPETRTSQLVGNTSDPGLLLNAFTINLATISSPTSPGAFFSTNPTNTQNISGAFELSQVIDGEPIRFNPASPPAPQSTDTLTGLLTINGTPHPNPFGAPVPADFARQLTFRFNDFQSGETLDYVVDMRDTFDATGAPSRPLVFTPTNQNRLANGLPANDLPIFWPAPLTEVTTVDLVGATVTATFSGGATLSGVVTLADASDGTIAINVAGRAGVGQRAADGIRIQASDTALLRNASIINNQILNSGNRGIAIGVRNAARAESVVIQGNTINGDILDASARSTTPIPSGTHGISLVADGAGALIDATIGGLRTNTLAGEEFSQRNLITRNGADGIHVESLNNATVRGSIVNNAISLNGGNGIGIFVDPSNVDFFNVAERRFIDSNEIVGNAGAGIRIESGVDGTGANNVRALVSRNTISDNAQGGLVARATGTTTDPAGNLLNLRVGGLNVGDANTFDSNTDVGIAVTVEGNSEAHALIRNNTIAGTNPGANFGGDGIFLRRADSALLSADVFANASTGNSGNGMRVVALGSDPNDVIQPMSGTPTIVDWNRNTFSSNAGQGAAFDLSGDSVTIADGSLNVINANGGNGIGVTTQGNAVFGDATVGLPPGRRTIFSSNTVTNNGGDGIALNSSGDSRILLDVTSNTTPDPAAPHNPLATGTTLIEGNQNGISFITSGTSESDILVRSQAFPTVINANRSNGIVVAASEQSNSLFTVHTTRITNNGNDGVQFQASDNTTTSLVVGGPGLGNTIQGNGRDGVRIQASGLARPTVVVNGNNIGGKDALGVPAGNGGNGVTILANGAVGTGNNANVSGPILQAAFTGNSISNNAFRGVDIQLIGAMGERDRTDPLIAVGDLDPVRITFTDSVIEANGTEGFSFLANAGFNQNREILISGVPVPPAAATDPPFPPYDPAGPNFLADNVGTLNGNSDYLEPYLNLRTESNSFLTVVDNVIRNNGVTGGVTAGAGMDLTVSTNAYVAADVTDNVFGGNAGADFQTRSITAIDPNTGIVAVPTASIDRGNPLSDSVFLDDTAQLDLRFDNNQGNGISVTALGAIYTATDAGKAFGALSGANRRADLFQVDNGPALGNPNNVFVNGLTAQDIEAAFSTGGYNLRAAADPLFPNIAFPPALP